MEIFNLIFKSFWHFIGSVFILSIAGSIITSLFKHFRLWGNINNFYINQPEETDKKESKKSKNPIDANGITQVFTDLFNEFKKKGNK